MIEVKTVPRCTECKSSDNVVRQRLIAEWIDLSTGEIVKTEQPVWTDEYECRACDVWWIASHA